MRRQVSHAIDLDVDRSVVIGIRYDNTIPEKRDVVGRFQSSVSVCIQ